MADKVKVLYVEDEPDIRETVSEILIDEGFDVLSASNGKEAVEIFLENKPDIVVSDIMMPDISGYDLLKIIRENKNISNNNIPFIFLSALGEKQDLIKGIELNANDYLTKPVDFELLSAKITEKYNNHQKIQNSHNQDIDGIKNQASNIIPSELNKYLEQIKNISANLKNEPYGPFPHRKYLEDIKQLNIGCVKMKSIIDNFTNGEIINKSLNSSEDIIKSKLLIDEFISSLDSEIQNKISFKEGRCNPKLRIDKKLIFDLVRKIFSSLLKIDNNCSFEINIIEDYLDQIIFVFHPISKNINNNLFNFINLERINENLEKHGYNLEISFKEDGSCLILLYIPNYRIIK